MGFLTLGGVITAIPFIWPRRRNVTRLWKYYFGKKPELAVGQIWSGAPGNWGAPKTEVHYEITVIDLDEGWITFLYGTSTDDEVEDSVETYEWANYAKRNKLYLFSEHESIEDLYWGELGGTDEDDEEENPFNPLGIFKKKD